MYRLCRQTSSGTYIFTCSQSEKGFRSCQVPIYFPPSFLVHWNSLLPTWNWRLSLLCSMNFQIPGYCSRHQFGQTVLLAKSLFPGSPTFCCSLGGCCYRCFCYYWSHSENFLRPTLGWWRHLWVQGWKEEDQRWVGRHQCDWWHAKHVWPVKMVMHYKTQQHIACYHSTSVHSTRIACGADWLAHYSVQCTG